MQTRRSWVGEEKNNKFSDVRDPEKYKGLAEDKAFMKSIKTRRPDSLTIGELRRIQSIANHGTEVRNNIDLAIAGLYRSKAMAIKLFNETEQIEYSHQIKLLERVRDTE